MCDTYTIILETVLHVVFPTVLCQILHHKSNIEGMFLFFLYSVTFLYKIILFILKFVIPGRQAFTSLKFLGLPPLSLATAQN